MLSFTDNVNPAANTGDTVSANRGDASISLWTYTGTTTCSTNSGDYLYNTGNSLNQTDETHNGEHICLYGEDNLGNYSTLVSSGPINVDITPPSTAPTCTTGTYFSGTINVSCTTNSGDYIRYTTAIPDPTPSSSIWVNQGFTSTTTLKAIECDNLNNCNTANITTEIYTLDNTAPVTTLSDTNPLRRTGDVNFTLIGNDAGVGFDSTYYKILAGNTSCSAGGYDQYTGAVQIAGTSGQELQFTLCYYSTDSLGNTESTQSQLYQIDLKGTTIGAPEIYGGIFYNNYFNGTVSIQSSLVDTGAGVQTGTCEYSVYDSIRSTWNPSSQVGTTLCQFTNFSTGQDFSWKFRAMDNLNNLGTSNQSDFIFDDVAPTVGEPIIYTGLVYNNSYFRGAISIQSTVADTGAGLYTSSCSYTTNGSSRSAGVYNGGFCQVQNITPTSDIQVQWNIYDNVTNSGTSIVKNYTYDNTAPTTTDDSSSTITGEDVLVHLFATDTGAGVAFTQYCVYNSGSNCSPNLVGTSVNVTCPE